VPYAPFAGGCSQQPLQQAAGVKGPVTALHRIEGDWKSPRSSSLRFAPNRTALQQGCSRSTPSITRNGQFPRSVVPWRSSEAYWAFQLIGLALQLGGGAVNWHPGDRFGRRPSVFGAFTLTPKFTLGSAGVWLAEEDDSAMPWCLRIRCAAAGVERMPPW